jgi:hypothetical protein
MRLAQEQLRPQGTEAQPFLVGWRRFAPGRGAAGQPDD